MRSSEIGGSLSPEREERTTGGKKKELRNPTKKRNSAKNYSSPSTKSCSKRGETSSKSEKGIPIKMKEEDLHPNEKKRNISKG